MLAVLEEQVDDDELPVLWIVVKYGKGGLLRIVVRHRQTKGMVAEDVVGTYLEKPDVFLEGSHGQPRAFLERVGEEDAVSMEAVLLVSIKNCHEKSEDWTD